MRDFQTPQKEHSRFSDSFSHRSKDPSQPKKPVKIAKKCLNSSFISVSVSGRVSADNPKESRDISAVEEISNASGSQSQITEDSVLALNPTLSTATEALLLSDVTPTSEINLIKDESVYSERFGFNEPDRSQNGLVELDVLRNFLQNTGSSSRDHQQKKLLNAFIKAVIDKYSALPDDRDIVVDLLRLGIVFLCCLVFTMALYVKFFFTSELHDPYTGPPPT